MRWLIVIVSNTEKSKLAFTSLGMKGYVTGRNLEQGQGHMEGRRRRRGQGKNKLAESIPILGDKVLMSLADFRGWTSLPAVSSSVMWSLWRFGAIVVGFIYLWLLEISLYFNGTIDIIGGGLTVKKYQKERGF